MYEQQTSGLEIFKAAVVGKSGLFLTSHKASLTLFTSLFGSWTSNNADNKVKEYIKVAMAAKGESHVLSCV